VIPLFRFLGIIPDFKKTEKEICAKSVFLKKLLDEPAVLCDNKSRQVKILDVEELEYAA